MNKFYGMILVVSALVTGSLAHADIDYGLEVGIRQQGGEVDSTTASAKSQMGFQFGGFVHFPVQGALHLRTGMLYTQRPLVAKDDTTGSETKISMAYLDVPVALMYKFEEYAGVYGGVNLSMNIDSSCDAAGCKVQDVKTPMIPLVFGATFKFAPNFGANLYFESAGGEVAKGLKNYRAVGANLMLTFD